MKVIIDNLEYVPRIVIHKRLSFSQLIEDCRKKQKLTLEQAADKIGCSKSFMWEMENKEVSVGRDILTRLHKDLNIPAVDLLIAKKEVFTLKY